MNEGWVKIHRSLLDNDLWLSESFTRGQAWIDIICLANHAASYFYVRGVKIDLQRGQLGWSEPRLADRWKWSRTKLRKFLNDLQKEQQIIQQKNNVTQVITIINYEKYQEKEQQTGQQKDSRKTAEEQQKDVNKNEKNENNDNKEIKIVDFDFLKFWNLYNKKVGDKTKILKKWSKLKQIDRDTILKTLPLFLQNITDKKFQPFPDTYLNNKRWNDELIQQPVSTRSDGFIPQPIYR